MIGVSYTFNLKAIDALRVRTQVLTELSFVANLDLIASSLERICERSRRNIRKRHAHCFRARCQQPYRGC